MIVSLRTVRAIVLVVWVSCAGAIVFAHFAYPQLLASALASALSVSPWLGAGTFLLLGALRGFTLIPSTVLVVTGLLFFPSLPLYLLLMLGILISSASVYGFSEFLRLDELFRARYARQIDRLTKAMERYELPVIVGWSMFPLTPTDLICYVAGTLRVNFWKFLLGIAIGEGIIVGVYVFALGRLAAYVGS